MITDSLVSFEKYLTLHERFAKVYDFLKSNILSQMEDGRVAIDGDNIYVTISTFEGKGADELPPVEVHDSYIDIHVLLEGVETIGFIDRALCLGKDVKYDEVADTAILNELPEVFTSWNMSPAFIALILSVPSSQTGNAAPVSAVTLYSSKETSEPSSFSL